MNPELILSKVMEDAATEYGIGIDPSHGTAAIVVCEYRDGKFFRFIPEEEWRLP